MIGLSRLCYQNWHIMLTAILVFPPNCAQIMLIFEICALRWEEHAWLYLEESNKTYSAPCVFRLLKRHANDVDFKMSKFTSKMLKWKSRPYVNKQLFKVIIDSCIATLYLVWLANNPRQGAFPLLVKHFPLGGILRAGQNFLTKAHRQ